MLNFKSFNELDFIEPSDKSRLFLEAVKRSISGTKTVNPNNLSLDSIDLDSLDKSNSQHTINFLLAVEELVDIENTSSYTSDEEECNPRFVELADAMDDLIWKVLNDYNSGLKLKDECLVDKDADEEHDKELIIQVSRRIAANECINNLYKDFLNNFRLPKELSSTEDYVKVPALDCPVSELEEVMLEKGYTVAKLSSIIGVRYGEDIVRIFEVEHEYDFLEDGLEYHVFNLAVALPTDNGSDFVTDVISLASYSRTEEMDIIRNMVQYASEVADKVKTAQSTQFSNLRDIPALKSSSIADLFLAAVRNSIDRTVTVRTSEIDEYSIDLETLKASKDRYAQELVTLLGESVALGSKSSKDAHLAMDISKAVENVCIFCSKDVLKLKDKYLIEKESSESHNTCEIFEAYKVIKYGDDARAIDPDFLDSFAFPQVLLEEESFIQLPTIDGPLGSYTATELRKRGDVFVGRDFIYLDYSGYDVFIKLEVNCYDILKNEGIDTFELPEIRILVQEQGKEGEGMYTLVTSYLANASQYEETIMKNIIFCTEKMFKQEQSKESEIQGF